MTLMEILDAFTFYGLDIMLLAALTTLCVQILKISLLKKCQKKILTFLPFIVGCLFYGAYTVLYNMDFRILVMSYVDVMEHGFSVGALSTIIYVWYEQFIRGKKGQSATEGVIATLIEGYVPTDAVEDAAARIADAIQKDVTGDGAVKATDILKEYCGEDMQEKDIKLLSRLIIETLAHMNAA